MCGDRWDVENKNTKIKLKEDVLKRPQKTPVFPTLDLF
jgi:hypothetical protein